MENDIIKDTDKFPCPSCGGNMHFDPESGMLKCEYCDNTSDFEKLNDEIKEYDFRKVDEQEVPVGEWAGDSINIKCESCGAQTVITDDTISRECAFCGSSHIVKLEEMKGISPESVIPFSITKKQATESLSKWLGKRMMAPRKLKKESRKDKFKGMYIPYWTYDSDTVYTYTAQAGDYYYVTETVRGADGKMSTQQVRKIRWRMVSGASAKYFDDIQVYATNKVEKGLLKRTEPYGLGKLHPFQAQFLSGFNAERYSIDVKEGWKEAEQYILSVLRDDVRQAVHADEIRNIVLNVNHKAIKYKHILVPLWIAGYTYAGKKYQVMVNGENGKIAGRAPVSAWKVLMLILGIAAFIALLYWLFTSGSPPM
ncbi:MAG: hypothetical protein JXN65_08260 [Clostridia bacterium]|nr:hypothetical protein [Clostridia bacterium]